MTSAKIWTRASNDIFWRVGRGRNARFRTFSTQWPLRTNRPTDRRMDKASHRVASPWLKNNGFWKPLTRTQDNQCLQDQQFPFQSRISPLFLPFRGEFPPPWDFFKWRLRALRCGNCSLQSRQTVSTSGDALLWTRVEWRRRCFERANVSWQMPHS